MKNPPLRFRREGLGAAVEETRPNMQMLISPGIVAWQDWPALEHFCSGSMFIGSAMRQNSVQKPIMLMGIAGSAAQN